MRTIFTYLILMNIIGNVRIFMIEYDEKNSMTLLFLN